MTADELLRQVRLVLQSVSEDGMDGEAVRSLEGWITRELRKKPPKQKPSARRGGRTITRAECTEPTCPWVNTDGCRRPKDHRWENRTYMLVNDEEG